MLFIPTKLHAPVDYIVGAALIAAPWIFQFSDHTAATVVPIVLGIGLIAYSLFTNYELGVWKVAPMAVHNLIDVAAGALLAASPWLFGFADSSANVWVPHLVVCEPCDNPPRCSPSPPLGGWLSSSAWPRSSSGSRRSSRAVTATAPRRPRTDVAPGRARAARSPSARPHRGATFWFMWNTFSGS